MKRYCVGATVLTVVVSAAFAFKSQAEYVKLASNGIIFLGFGDHEAATDFAVIHGMIAIIMALVNAVLLVGMIGVLLYRSIGRKGSIGVVQRGRRQTTMAWVSNVPSREINLSLFTILLSATMTLVLVYAFMATRKNRNFLGLFQKLILHFYIDTISVINPFGLLLVSKTLRERIAHSLIPSKLFENWKAKILQGFARFIQFLAVLYFLYLSVMIVAFFDAYFTCGVWNFTYDGKLCQAAMECQRRKIIFKDRYTVQ